jgi:hypothetical protein
MKYPFFGIIFAFSTLEIHFLFFKNEFREGTYTPLWGARIVLKILTAAIEVDGAISNVF